MSNRRRAILGSALQRQDGACFYCGCRLRLGPGGPPAMAAERLALIRTATPDHFVPASKGGGNGGANIVAACAPCNQAKGDRLPTLGEMVRYVELHCVGAAQRTGRSGPLTASLTYRASMTIDAQMVAARIVATRARS